MKRCVLWIVSVAAAALFGFFIQKPVRDYLHSQEERRLAPEKLIADADNVRGAFAESGFVRAVSEYQRALKLIGANGSGGERCSRRDLCAQAYQGLSRTYADWSIVKLRLGLAVGDYPQRAVSYALRAARYAPQTLETDLAMAYALESAEPAGQAVKAKLREMEGRYPQNQDVQYLAWMARSDPSAEQFEDAASPDDVTDVRMLIDIGIRCAMPPKPFQARRKEGELARASRFCDAARQRAPQNPLGPFCSGYAAASGKNWEEAKRFFDSALEREPDFPRAQNDLGVALAVEGKYREAAREFEAAALTVGVPEGNEVPWLYNLGSARLEAGENKKACTAWRQASSLPGASTDFLVPWGLSVCDWAMRRESQARGEYCQAVALAKKKGVDLTKISTFESMPVGPRELDSARHLTLTKCTR
jgi:tetratricopeptide (TPR) repeat protein